MLRPADPARLQHIYRETHRHVERPALRGL